MTASPRTLAGNLTPTHTRNSLLRCLLFRKRPLPALSDPHPSPFPWHCFISSLFHAPHPVRAKPESSSQIHPLPASVFYSSTSSHPTWPAPGASDLVSWLCLLLPFSPSTPFPTQGSRGDLYNVHRIIYSGRSASRTPTVAADAQGALGSLPQWPRGLRGEVLIPSTPKARKMDRTPAHPKLAK